MDEVVRQSKEENSIFKIIYTKKIISSDMLSKSSIIKGFSFSKE